jgi:ribosomal protein L10
LNLLKNKRLLNYYKNILSNNEIILFCELNSFNSSNLKKLKINLKKEGFVLTRIKNKVFKKQIENSKLKNLVNGPIFILYKQKLDLNDINNFKILQKFIDYKFILCCLFDSKLYTPLILKQFKKMMSIERLTFESGISINTLLSVKLNNTIKQIAN